ncbi:hypothetical protein BD413DRAFT_236006 [Trametes elegans]|nr:hypothetical protein BD413DRAFT_236006 [Trametes elegans]
MPPAEPKLPNGLLIILHLHLLNFPLQDATGYDERLFDSSRGMRERNKAMEDISYFLVGKIEHGKDRAKAILPTYPCLQPSDTTAFKIALAKYIEAIRNSVVHTTRANTGDKQLDQQGKHPGPPGQDDAPAAWWWKDVVVRKSILDECCGERFERLILALSSHAVLKNTTRRAPSALQPLSAREHAVRVPHMNPRPIHLRVFVPPLIVLPARSRARSPRHTPLGSQRRRASGWAGSDPRPSWCAGQRTWP